MAAQAVEQADAFQAEMNAEANETLTATETAQAESPEGAIEQATNQPTPSQPAKKRRRNAVESAVRIFHEGERITVARRLYRTGDSEYEMNGRACRLRDVQELFAGTGLGAAHYAIIEQGRIGQVLSAKPMDRRALIEEAAGISKFKMRQHSAELKLEASKQNLSRITDILAEIERQQNSLRRQAGRTRRFQKFKHEMRGLMRSVYVVDYRSTNRTLAELESALEAGVMREAEITGSIAQLEEDQSFAAQTSRTAEEKLNETRQIAADINVEVERSRQQHNYLTQQLQSLGTRASQFAKDQAVIAERGQFIRQETSRLREELQGIEQDINAESKSLAEAENDHRAQTESDAGAERTLEDARKKVYDSGTHLERWRQLNRQFVESVDRCDTKLQGLTVERERAAAQAEAAGDQHAQLSFTVEERSERQQQVSEEFAEITTELGIVRRQREEKQAQLTTLQRELTVTEQRLKSLAQLDEKHSYFSEAVQALFSHQSAGAAGAAGATGAAGAAVAAETASPLGFKTMGTLAD
ncbi:MAG: hypothetical protein M3X11_09900, partial [Acidobacteriota bacterium]|nr:hypothetical protein [Acidobacteriota bacterium]